MKDATSIWASLIIVGLIAIGAYFAGPAAGSNQQQEVTDPVSGAITSTTKAIIKAAGFQSASGDLTLTAGDLTVGGATALETLTQGGGIRATSTDDTTATFLASDFDVENMIEFTPNVAGITATLPAVSTLTSFIPNAGDHRSIMICNATTTAATTFTLAKGANMNFHNASTSAAINTGKCASLEFYRATDTDIEVFVGNGG